jgi:pyruvate,water dikinase
MMIEAIFGLGENVVSGHATPDHYVVDRAGTVKDERLVNGGVLKPDELVELAGLGRLLQEQFGAPQDIEFSIADGKVYLLQSRPITTL